MSRPIVLIADDYPENLQLFTLYLRKTYEVVTAVSAEEVIEILDRQPIDAALLDLNYQGGMTGMELIRYIRESDRFADLPTMALTAHASPEDKRKCLEAGFDVYVSKPVLKAQMLEETEALLQKAIA
ncbi:MAG: response regulator [Bacteroidota bacterium]